VDQGTGSYNDSLKNLNHEKIFFRSPLVYAASKGRQDLVETIVNTYGYDVDSAEELTGINALGSAILSGDKVKFFITIYGRVSTFWLFKSIKKLFFLVPEKNLKRFCLSVTF